MNKLMKRVGAATAAFALVFALAGTTSAGGTNWATVFDHYNSDPSDKSNEGAFWENKYDLKTGACHKLTKEEFDAVDNGDGTADLGAAYGYVIVKQASSSSVKWDNTIFKDVAADETVFADTDGDGAYGEGDSHGISHIIVCDPTTTTTTTTNTFTSTTGGETDKATLPNTATIVTGNAAPSDGAWMLVIVLGVLLGSVVLLAPAKARTRR